MKITLKTPKLALLIGLIVAVSSHAQSFLTNGLISYYPFNGNANDAVGTNNGTVHGATLTSNRFGVANSAYLFNGSSSYIDLGRPTNLQFQSNFTLSAWCLFSGGSLENPRIISYCWGQGYELLTQGNGSSRAFEFISGNYDFNTTSSYSQSVWRAVTLVYTNGTGYFYVNGAFAGSGTNPPPIAFTDNLHIGNNPGATPYQDYWGGCIDDVRFYNRALSSIEVSQLYKIESVPIINIQKAVYLTCNYLSIGSNYQVQVSSDLINWTNQGSVFTATSSYWQSTNYWQVANWNQLFFRLEKQ